MYGYRLICAEGSRTQSAVGEKILNKMWRFVEKSGILWFNKVPQWSEGVWEVSFVSYFGEYQHAIDEKGRLIMPVKFRDSLGAKYMLSKGIEACLTIYPMETWVKLEEKVSSLDDFNLSNRDLKRRFFSGSGECELDKQGRTLINQEFRNYGNLTKDVYIVGAGDHAEIWDKETWEGYRRGVYETYQARAEEKFNDRIQP